MSDGYSYIVEMVDRISGPAKTAQQQIAGMSSKLAAGSDELAKLRKQLLDVTQAEDLDIKKRDQLVKAIQRQEGALDGLGGKIRKSVDEQRNMAKAAQSADADGQVALLGEIAGGFAAVAAAAAAATVVIGGIVVAGAAFALEATAAKKSMLSMFDAMGAGVDTGLETEAMIDNLKAKTGVLKDELVGYTNTLQAMGETDLSKIETSITAMASSSAIMGKEGVSAFTNLKAKIEQATTAGVGLKLADKQMASLYKTGVNVDDVAKAMGVSAKTLRNQLNSGSADATKFGIALEKALTEKGSGPLETMTSQLPYLKKQFLESMGDIFEDIEVQPFLDSVKDLFKIFSQASPAGQALKAGIGGFFNEVFAVATKVVPYVKSFLLDLVIYGLRAYIALKPIANEIKAWASSAEGAKTITFVLDTLIGGFKVVAGVALFAGAAFAVAVAAVVAVNVAILATGYAIAAFIAWVPNAMANLGKSAYTAAGDFVTGLVTGISDGASAVYKSVTSLADGATNAFKDALGIHSPSTVMQEQGGYLGEGVAMGVDDSSANVNKSLANVVDPSAVGGAGGGGGGGGGISITFEAGAIVIQGGAGNAAEIAETIASELADKLEIMWAQLGGGPATAGAS